MVFCLPKLRVPTGLLFLDGDDGNGLVVGCDCTDTAHHIWVFVLVQLQCVGVE
jgi:hypothetical protein